MPRQLELLKRAYTLILNPEPGLSTGDFPIKHFAALEDFSPMDEIVARSTLEAAAAEVLAELSYSPTPEVLSEPSAKRGLIATAYKGLDPVFLVDRLGQEYLREAYARAIEAETEFAKFKCRKRPS